MKTVVTIPIRLGAKRVLGNNVKSFLDGTPLISFIHCACLDAGNIDEINEHC